MSHEIRTPLNGIMAAAELLSADELGEGPRHLTEIIRSSSESLRATIEDVLDFSRIEAGRLNLEMSQFSLVRLVEDAAEMLSMRAAEKGLALSLLVEPATHDHLRGDPQRLRQVLVNLVGNAIKFTETGYVAIRVMAEAEGEAGISLLVEVLDTGIGVPPDHRGDIFGAFEQGDNSTQRRFGGTGLGLAISRAIVQGMGGAIGVDPGPEGGSRFWFRVPLECLPDRRRQPEADLTGLRVRVEEACAPRRQALLRYLASAGAVIVESHAQVVLASDGAAPCPDGAVQVVLPPPAAPVRRSALIRWVGEASGRSTPAVEVNRRADDPPSAASGRRLLLAEDHAANQTVLRMMIEQMGHSVTIAANGVQAWELLRQAPFDLLISDCHMPEMDGPTLLRRIRAAEHGTDQHLPAIALTADARSESVEDCKLAGFDLWLAKPVTRRELRRGIDAALARHSLTATARPSAPQLDAPVLDPNVLLEEVLIGRTEMLVPLLNEFISATRPDMEALERAWEAGEPETARKCSHTAKGAARMAGALRLAALCQSFENDIRDNRLDQASAWPRRIAEGFQEVEAA
ncbi:MAG: response regulator, partial [Magnetospirillum sp.]|nr:response regulator [Magnetospirillum sp.]